jgi:hypothetical protein
MALIALTAAMSPGSAAMPAWKSLAAEPVGAPPADPEPIACPTLTPALKAALAVASEFW